MLRLVYSANDNERDTRSRYFERGDHVELGEALIEQLASGTQAVFADGSFYAYDAPSGVWRTVSTDACSQHLQRFAGAPAGDKEQPLKIRRADVSGAIDLARHRLSTDRFFAAAADGLAFANGFVTVSADGVRVLPHAIEHRARSSFAINFDASATCHTFMSMLDTAFRGDADADGKIAALQEMAGACALGIAARYQRAFFLVGAGGEGKSTVLDVIRGAIPSGAVAAIPPSQWGSEYCRAQLAGIRMNVVSELPDSRIADSSAFKAIITGDPINGRHIRERPFTFSPIAGHLFAANELPETKDLSEGFWRRIIVVAFENKVPPEACERGLADRVIRTELSGVIRWATEGAVRLLANGSYTVPTSSAAKVQEWRRNANPIAAFFAQRTRREADPSQWTPAERLYVAYRFWCDKTGHTRESETMFGRRARQLGIGSVHKATGNRYPVVLLNDARDE
jgi:P4 family phage/plasmid primase-like protien